LPLLDKQLPPDVSPELAERFQGFSQHMLASLTAWRRQLARSFAALHSLRIFGREVDLMGPEARGGPEFAALLQEQLQVRFLIFNHCSGSGIRCFFTPQIRDPDPGCFYPRSRIRPVFV
jgi:hypothetical protein